MPGERPVGLPPVPLVALLTDFGADEYAGMVKGVIAGLWPQARFVDLCHAIRPHAVREAAWTLLASYRYFPTGTLFFAVVDPGVGTSRAALAVETRRYRFVGPDNGILFPAVQDDGRARIVRLLVPLDASSTFHGRDVFAPAAGRWAAGGRLSDLGEPFTGRLRALRFARSPRWAEVVRVDRFGNVVTAALPPAEWSRGARIDVSVWRRAGRRWASAGPGSAASWVRTYHEAAPGTLVALAGSAGTVEVACVEGSAALVLGVAPGDRVRMVALRATGGGTR